MRLSWCLAFVLALGTSSFAAETAREALDRGLVARPVAEGRVYLGWRLLATDPASVAFNVYRRTGDGKAVKLSAEPIAKTTDFVDTTAAQGTEHAWFVAPVVNGQEGSPSGEVRATPTAKDAKPYVSIPLNGKYTFQKVGIADLDGDQKYDLVIKQPHDNIDPYEKYWKPSPDTYKLEAYANDGRFLWRYDLGWAIERGIWYSPYVVYDLDGDGKAEVAVKTGEGDPRDKDGRVSSSQEYLTILNGQTGKPIAETKWLPREDFNSYNLASRNQIGVAYLDGKTPSLIVARGTYSLMMAVAYQFRDGKLQEQWRWDNRDLPKQWKGQGAHWMHAADVDADGREEVLLGSVVLDDNGKALWCTGLGHPDHFYIGDLDPDHPGLEIYYGIETRGKKNTMSLVDAKTGEILWGHKEPTVHIHHAGLCSDIDAKHPGAECYSGERDFKDKRWLRDSKGNVLSTKDLGGLAPRAVYWDADLQRELLVGSQIRDYEGSQQPVRIEGQMVAVVDLLGDWREEIITSAAGELRIYVTTLPAADRRACLMQDPIYRADVIHAAMGYYQVPMTSYDLPTGRR
jgi:rhamnogalacturonan endolyase